MKLRATPGSTAAALTVLAALLTPFLLMGTFAKGFAALGFHVDEIYSGGPMVRAFRWGHTPSTFTALSIRICCKAQSPSSSLIGSP